MAAAGPAVAESPPVPVITETQTMITAAFTDGRTIAIDDYAALPAASQTLVDMGMQSLVIFPVKVGERTLGLVTVISKEKSHFPAELVEMLRAVGEGLGILLENSMLHDETGKAHEALLNSEERYRLLFENANDGILTFDLNSVITDVNRETEAMLGYSREELIEQRSILHLTHASALLAEQRMRKWLSGDEIPPVIELEGVCKDGSAAFFEGRTQFIQDQQGNPTGYQGIFRDTTERRRSEAALHRLAEENSLMAEIGRVISSSLDINEVYGRFGEEVRKLIPFDRLIINLSDLEAGTFVNAYVKGLDVPGRRPTEAAALSGSFTGTIMKSSSAMLVQPADINELSHQFPGLAPLYKAGARSFLAAPLVSNNEVIGVIHFASTQEKAYDARDLSLAEGVGNQIAGAIANSQLFAERVQAEDALLDSEERYRCLVDFSPDAIVVVDKEKFLFANPAAAFLYGAADPSELIGMRWPEFNHADSQEAAGAMIRMITKEGQAAPLHETKIVRLDGQVRDVETVGIPITYQGEPAFQAVVRDITDRKQAENRLKDSLKEKEVLFQEINHRVKNNLQIVISLLNLQSRGIEYARWQDLLRESQERIKAIALIHEKLYGSIDMANIDFEDYLHSLTKDLRMSHGLDSGNITLTVEAAEKSLDIDTAIPCGLIVNELVSNSLKHAFPANGGGEIGVSLISAEGRNRLVVKDSGSGFPEGFDIKKTDTLGLKLVNALVDQLGGNIELHHNGGTEICITFGQS